MVVARFLGATDGARGEGRGAGCDGGVPRGPRQALRWPIRAAAALFYNSGGTRGGAERAAALNLFMIFPAQNGRRRCPHLQGAGRGASSESARSFSNRIVVVVVVVVVVVGGGGGGHPAAAELLFADAQAAYEAALALREGLLGPAQIPTPSPRSTTSRSFFSSPRRRPRRRDAPACRSSTPSACRKNDGGGDDREWADADGEEAEP